MTETKDRLALDLITLIAEHAKRHGITCETCGGSGVDDVDECRSCMGMGVTPEQGVEALQACGSSDAG